jgi:hypothetical protein
MIKTGDIGKSVVAFRKKTAHDRSVEIVGSHLAANSRGRDWLPWVRHHER